MCKQLLHSRASNLSLIDALQCCTNGLSKLSACFTTIGNGLSQLLVSSLCARHSNFPALRTQLELYQPLWTLWLLYPRLMSCMSCHWLGAPLSQPGPVYRHLCASCLLTTRLRLLVPLLHTSACRLLLRYIIHALTVLSLCLLLSTRCPSAPPRAHPQPAEWTRSPTKYSMSSCWALASPSASSLACSLSKARRSSTLIGASRAAGHR